MVKRSLLDMVGIVLSATCLVHCLLLPVVLALVPVSALIGLNDETFHFVLAWVILPISGLALLLGVQRHRHASVAIIGSIGISLLFVAAFLGHDQIGVVGERGLTVLGSLLVAGAHLLNFRFSGRRTGSGTPT